jgi:hypothetical protein
MNVNVARTPSKIVPATPEFEGSKFSRTPMSEGRRFMLDMIVTPRHKKQEADSQKTPSSTDKLFQTPAFLQRYGAPMGTLQEEATPQVKMTVPWRRTGFGRSLSSMIQSIRKEEDDKFDHEMDIMRELEDEDYGISRPAPKSKSKAVQFEDITPVKDTMNSTLDDDGFMPSDVEGQLKEMDAAEAKAAEKAGRPLRIYKKKGLKRQTKRVNSRLFRGLDLFWILANNIQCVQYEESRSQKRMAKLQSPKLKKRVMKMRKEFPQILFLKRNTMN